MCEFDWDLAIKASTLIVIAIGAWLGIAELHNTQKWKRAEFLAQKHKEFTDNTYVQKTMRMLDGFAILLPVDKNEFDGQKEYIDFTPGKLLKALSDRQHETQPDKEAVYISLCIDKFLFRLGNFQNYLDNNLVDRPQVENLLGYWIGAIGDKNNGVINNEIKSLLHNYIKVHNYKSLIKLLKNFGYEI